MKKYNCPGCRMHICRGCSHIKVIKGLNKKAGKRSAYKFNMPRL